MSIKKGRPSLNAALCFAVSDLGLHRMVIRFCFKRRYNTTLTLFRYTYPNVSSTIPHKMFAPLSLAVGVHVMSQTLTPGLEGSSFIGLTLNPGGVVDTRP